MARKKKFNLDQAVVEAQDRVQEWIDSSFAQLQQEVRIQFEESRKKLFNEGEKQ